MSTGDDILVRAFCHHAYVTSDSVCHHCGELLTLDWSALCDDETSAAADD
jgi:hypothetical protein